MTFPEAVKSAFKNYVKFTGRASRSEFWWFFLFEIIVLIIPAILMSGENARGEFGLFSALYGLVGLALFLPALGLVFRRLHDTDRSAWWILIGLLPFIGGLVLLVFYCLPGTPGPNKYGPPPGILPDVVANTFS